MIIAGQCRPPAFADVGSTTLFCDHPPAMQGFYQQDGSRGDIKQIKKTALRPSFFVLLSFEGVGHVLIYKYSRNRCDYHLGHHIKSVIRY